MITLRVYLVVVFIAICTGLDVKTSCIKSVWTTEYVTKSTGSKVKISVTQKPVLMNWFQAASCCKFWNQNLLSISTINDLVAYQQVVSKTNAKFTGWTDITGFGKDWRNGKGKYYSTGIGTNMFAETPPHPIVRGWCKKIGPRSNETDKYFLTNSECMTPNPEVVYCEMNDPLEANFNYDCDKKFPTKAKSEWREQSYWESLLSFNPNCEVQPIEDKTIAVSSDQLSWHEALASCKKNGLDLLTIDSQRDAEYLRASMILKTAPYSASTRFWTAARFTESSENMDRLYWEPMHKEIPNCLDNFANGINKQWTTAPDVAPEEGKVCVDLQLLAANEPLRWTVSDCLDKNYYICIRPSNQRYRETIKKLPQAKIA